MKKGFGRGLYGESRKIMNLIDPLKPRTSPSYLAQCSWLPVASKVVLVITAATKPALQMRPATERLPEVRRPRASKFSIAPNKLHAPKNEYSQQSSNGLYWEHLVPCPGRVPT